jgi:hypothetical protein
MVHLGLSCVLLFYICCTTGVCGPVVVVGTPVLMVGVSFVVVFGCCGELMPKFS